VLGGKKGRRIEREMVIAIQRRRRRRGGE